MNNKIIASKASFGLSVIVIIVLSAAGFYAIHLCAEKKEKKKRKQEKTDEEQPPSKPSSNLIENAEPGRDKVLFKHGRHKSALQDTRQHLSPPSSLTMVGADPVRGLENLGNTCYFNSTMQPLVHTNHMFREELQRHSTNGDFVLEVLKFFAEMQHSNPGPYSPDDVHRLFGKKSPKFSDFRQHDSHECLRNFLDNIRKEERDSTDAADKRKVLTVVDSVFGGHFMTVYICKKCETPYHVCEALLDISLPIMIDAQDLAEMNAAIRNRGKTYMTVKQQTQNKPIKYRSQTSGLNKSKATRSSIMNSTDAENLTELKPSETDQNASLLVSSQQNTSSRPNVQDAGQSETPHGLEEDLGQPVQNLILDETHKEALGPRDGSRVLYVLPKEQDNDAEGQQNRHHVGNGEQVGEAQVGEEKGLEELKQQDEGESGKQVESEGDQQDETGGVQLDEGGRGKQDERGGGQQEEREEGQRHEGGRGQQDERGGCQQDERGGGQQGKRGIRQQDEEERRQQDEDERRQQDEEERRQQDEGQRGPQDEGEGGQQDERGEGQQDEKGEGPQDEMGSGQHDERRRRHQDEGDRRQQDERGGCQQDERGGGQQDEEERRQEDEEERRQQDEGQRGPQDEGEGGQQDEKGEGPQDEMGSGQHDERRRRHQDEGDRRQQDESGGGQQDEGERRQQHAVETKNEEEDKEKQDDEEEENHGQQLTEQAMQKSDKKDGDESSDEYRVAIEKLMTPLSFASSMPNNETASGKHVTIDNCLMYFTRKEHIKDEYLCNDCYGEHLAKGGTDLLLTSATKQTLIFNPPAILTLHLKRFELKKGGSVKRNDMIIYEELLDIAPYCSSMCLRNDSPCSNIWYSLYGVVVHHGSSLKFGHYMAYVKIKDNDTGFKKFLQQKYFDRDLTREQLVEMMHAKRREDTSKQRDGTWYCMNDSWVHKVSVDEVLDQEAYLLFYERMI